MKVDKNSPLGEMLLKMLVCHTMGLTSCTAKNSNIQLSTKKGLL